MMTTGKVDEQKIEVLIIRKCFESLLDIKLFLTASLCHAL